jgi:hypothetical protein
LPVLITVVFIVDNDYQHLFLLELTVKEPTKHQASKPAKLAGRRQLITLLLPSVMRPVLALLWDSCCARLVLYGTRAYQTAYNCGHSTNKYSNQLTCTASHEDTTTTNNINNKITNNNNNNDNKRANPTIKGSMACERNKKNHWYTLANNNNNDDNNNNQQKHIIKTRMHTGTHIQ